MVRLTVVNDNPELLDLIGDILEGDRYATTLIDSVGDDLLERICRSRPDLLMIDLRHGDDARHGWEIVRQVRRVVGCEHLPVVLCTADIAALDEMKPEVQAVGDVVTLRLPFEIDELLRSVRSLTQ